MRVKALEILNPSREWAKLGIFYDGQCEEKSKGGGWKCYGKIIEVLMAFGKCGIIPRHKAKFG